MTNKNDHPNTDDKNDPPTTGDHHESSGVNTSATPANNTDSKHSSYDPDEELVYRKIDPSSPYYLSPSEHGGIMISTVQFTGKNYDTWARAMRRSLKGRKKFGFVDGSIKKPANPIYLTDWDAVQSTLVSWIMNSIVEKEQRSIPSFEEARPLWDMLKKRYTVSSGQRGQELKQALAECKQTGSMTVAEYLGELQTLWEELEVYDPIPECVCGLGEYFLTRRDRERFNDFMYGINVHKHGVMRSQLLAMEPRPTLDFAYQKMGEDERLKDKDAMEKPDNAPAMSFAVQTHPTFAVPTQPLPFSVHNQPRGNSDSITRYLPHVKCSHCDRPGHDASTCFPPWWGDRP